MTDTKNFVETILFEKNYKKASPENTTHCFFYWIKNRDSGFELEKLNFLACLAILVI